MPVPEAPQVVNVPTPAAPVAAANEPAVAAPTAPAPTQQSEVEQELAAPAPGHRRGGSAAARARGGARCQQ